MFDSDEFAASFVGWSRCPVSAVRVQFSDWEERGPSFMLTFSCQVTLAAAPGVGTVESSG
jgi:hypothetical protein